MDFHARDEGHIQEIEAVVLAVEHDQGAAWGSQGREVRVGDGEGLISGQVNGERLERIRPEESSEFIGTHILVYATGDREIQAG